jgi:hypothetical protein
VSSPLRRLSFDLLERSATVLALKALQADLALGAMQAASSSPPASSYSSGGASAAAGKRDEASLVWLDEFLEKGQWWEQLAGVSSQLYRRDGSDVALNTVSDRLITALLAAPRAKPAAPGYITKASRGSPFGARGASGGVGPASPHVLADKLRTLREKCAIALAAQLEQCDDALASVKADVAARARLERMI